MKNSDTPMGKAYIKAKDDVTEEEREFIRKKNTPTSEPPAPNYDDPFYKIAKVITDDKLAVGTVLAGGAAAAAKAVANAKIINDMATGKLADTQLNAMLRTVHDNLGRVSAQSQQEYIQLMKGEVASGVTVAARRYQANPTAANAKALEAAMKPLGGRENITIVRGSDGNIRGINIKPNPEFTKWQENLAKSIENARAQRELLQDQSVQGKRAQQKILGKSQWKQRQIQGKAEAKAMKMWEQQVMGPPARSEARSSGSSTFRAFINRLGGGGLKNQGK